MSVSDDLDSFRAAVPECRFVAFMDLDASMVLSVSVQTKKRQEVLDGLAERASKLLPLAEDSLSKSLALGEEPALPDLAVLLSERETLVFIRSGSERHEALCCGCSPNAAIDAIITSARAALSGLSAGD